MKVLKIIHTLGHGGAENTFRRLAWGLQRTGIEVIAAISEVSEPCKENWIAPALEELEVPCVTFDKNGTPRQLLRNLAAVVDQVRPDIVHSHLLDSNFYSALACRIRSVPHICTEHGDVSLKQTAVSRVKYAIITICTRFVICVSGAVRESASRVIPFRSKLKTIYNGIQFLEKTRSSLRGEFNIPDDAIVIGNVGNLYSVKGQKYLVRAFAEVCSTCPQTFLVVVGRGGEENNLRQLVTDLNIPRERVLFTGFRNDIENVMNAFDLYVHPSLSEGHPVAVLEAMSLGVPVIATAVGGTSEIMEAERYGTLVAPKSHESLVFGIRSYLRDRSEFHAKASAARTFVRSEFSVERMVNNYIECYRETLGWQEG